MNTRGGTHANHPSSPTFRIPPETPMSASTLMPPGYSASGPSAASQSLVGIDVEGEEFFCPVCGVELTLADFERPENDYYCPYCSTRQTPALV